MFTRSDQTYTVYMIWTRALCRILARPNHNSTPTFHGRISMRHREGPGSRTTFSSLQCDSVHSITKTKPSSRGAETVLKRSCRWSRPPALEMVCHWTQLQASSVGALRTKKPLYIILHLFVRCKQWRLNTFQKCTSLSAHCVYIHACSSAHGCHSNTRASSRPAPLAASPAPSAGS